MPGEANLTFNYREVEEKLKMLREQLEREKPRSRSEESVGLSGMTRTMCAVNQANPA